MVAVLRKQNRAEAEMMADCICAAEARYARDTPEIHGWWRTTFLMWQVAQLLTPRICALASHHSPPTPDERERVYSLYYDKFNRDQSRVIAYLRECAIVMMKCSGGEAKSVLRSDVEALLDELGGDLAEGADSEKVIKRIAGRADALGGLSARDLSARDLSAWSFGIRHGLCLVHRSDRPPRRARQEARQGPAGDPSRVSPRVSRGRGGRR